MDTNKNLITIAGVCLAVGLIIGFIARGFFSGTFDDGWQAAREKLSGGTSAERAAVIELSGSIKERRADALVLSTGLLHPLDDRDLAERLVEVNKDTVVALRRRKTSEELYGQEAAAQIIAQQTKAADNNQDRTTILQASQEIQRIKTAALQKLNEQAMLLRDQLNGLTPEQTTEKAALTSQIDDLMSDYLYEPFGFDQIQPNDLVKVTAAEDIAEEQKFTAVKIEVTRN